MLRGCVSQAGGENQGNEIRWCTTLPDVNTLDPACTMNSLLAVKTHNWTRKIYKTSKKKLFHL